MLRYLLHKGLYAVKACLMLNLMVSMGCFIRAGLANRIDQWLTLTLLLLAACTFIVALIQAESPVMGLNPMLAFLPVAALDQLGTAYFRHRIRMIGKTLVCNDNKPLA